MCRGMMSFLYGGGRTFHCVPAAFRRLIKWRKELSGWNSLRFTKPQMTCSVLGTATKSCLLPAVFPFPSSRITNSLRSKGLMGDTLLIATAGLFFAGIIKGATGIGYSSCALPFLTAALGIETAMALVVFPAVASNLALLWTNGSLGCALRRFWPLYLATLPGIAAGAVLLMWVDKSLPAQVLGVLIAGYAIQAWLKPSFALGPGLASAVRVPVGFLNGLLTGFTGSQVMPLMPYMLALNLDSRLLVQAVNVAVVISSLLLGFALWATGALH